MQTLDAAPERVLEAPRRDRSPRIVGIACALATFGWLMLGANRAYDLDDSLTVGIFVATPDVTDAFTQAYVLNNHVFFSFLDHLVYTATGSQAEITMRLLPIVFAAAAVGLLAGLLTRRLGWVAGASAAAVLATNPMYADVGSQVRGYSLVVLLTIATSALLLDAIRHDRATTGGRVLYAVLAAIGAATHLYMLVVIGVHVITATVNRKVQRAWIPAWLASLLGLAVYSWVWRDMRETADSLGRRFRGGFPLDLGVAVLGGSVLAALLTLAIVLPVLWRARHSRLVQLAGLGVLLAVAGVWLVGPFDLYPRFFLWLAPLPAVGVAFAVGRRTLLVGAVVALVALQLVVAWPRVTQDPYASRTVRDVFARVRAAGQIPCTIDDYATLRLTGYTDEFAIASDRRGLDACAVAVLLAPAQVERSRQARAANAAFAHEIVLDARHDATLWSRVPVECWISDSPPARSGCPRSR
jgi:hypothetical protein